MRILCGTRKLINGGFRQRQSACDLRGISRASHWKNAQLGESNRGDANHADRTSAVDVVLRHRTIRDGRVNRAARSAETPPLRALINRFLEEEEEPLNLHLLRPGHRTHAVCGCCFVVVPPRIGRAFRSEKVRIAPGVGHSIQLSISRRNQRELVCPVAGVIVVSGGGVAGDGAAHRTIPNDCVATAVE